MRLGLDLIQCVFNNSIQNKRLDQKSWLWFFIFSLFYLNLISIILTWLDLIKPMLKKRDKQIILVN